MNPKGRPTLYEERMKALSIQLDSDTLERLRALALAERVSVAHVIRRMIVAALPARTAKRPRA